MVHYTDSPTERINSLRITSEHRKSERIKSHTYNASQSINKQRIMPSIE
jgi:hypothetical protein